MSDLPQVTTRWDGVGATASVITILQTTLSLTNLVWERLREPMARREIELARQEVDGYRNALGLTIQNLESIPESAPPIAETEQIRQLFNQLNSDLNSTWGTLSVYDQHHASLWARALGKEEIRNIEIRMGRTRQQLLLSYATMLESLHRQLRLAKGELEQSRGQIPDLFLPLHRMMDAVIKGATTVDRQKLCRDVGEVPTSAPYGRWSRGRLDGTPVIIEYREYDEVIGDSDVQDFGASIASLAAILSQFELQSMNVLKCSAYIHDRPNHRFGLVFALRSDHGYFRTLKEIIEATPRASHSLKRRIDIARRMATAVAFVHGVNWVHKAVRPRNVLVIAPATAGRPEAQAMPVLGKQLGDSFLTGFDRSRPEKGNSDQTESADWRDRIYRHPERHETSQNAYFAPYHDIYALGVVLVELARWRLLEKEVRDGTTVGPNEQRVQVSVLANLDSQEMKKAIVGFAAKIDRVVGPAYQRAAQRCLEADESMGKATFIREIVTPLEELYYAL